MLMVRQRLAELKANPPECRCGLCAPAHNGIVGLFWAILFSLPCWLGLWAGALFPLRPAVLGMTGSPRRGPPPLAPAVAAALRTRRQALFPAGLCRSAERLAPAAADRAQLLAVLRLGEQRLRLALGHVGGAHNAVQASADAHPRVVPLVHGVVVGVGHSRTDPCHGPGHPEDGQDFPGVLKGHQLCLTVKMDERLLLETTSARPVAHPRFRMSSSGPGFPRRAGATGPVGVVSERGGAKASPLRLAELDQHAPLLTVTWLPWPANWVPQTLALKTPAFCWLLDRATPPALMMALSCELASVTVAPAMVTTLSRLPLTKATPPAATRYVVLLGTLAGHRNAVDGDDVVAGALRAGQRACLRQTGEGLPWFSGVGAGVIGVDSAWVKLACGSVFCGAAGAVVVGAGVAAAGGAGAGVTTGSDVVGSSSAAAETASESNDVTDAGGDESVVATDELVAGSGLALDSLCCADSVVFGLPEADADGSAFDDPVPGASSVVEALAPEDDVAELSDEAVLGLPVGEDELSDAVLSAWAIPVPLASAIPMPRLTAPAPSHRYGSRPAGFARWTAPLRRTEPLRRLPERSLPAMTALTL